MWNSPVVLPGHKCLQAEISLHYWELKWYSLKMSLLIELAVLLDQISCNFLEHIQTFIPTLKPLLSFNPHKQAKPEISRARKCITRKKGMLRLLGQGGIGEREGENPLLVRVKTLAHTHTYPKTTINISAQNVS